jgi:hypothetical protein
MLYSEGQLARAELVLEPEVLQQAPRFVALATITTESPQTPRSAEPAALSMPDFTGKRLSTARKEAKALGLKLVARDAYGDRIEPDFAAFYRVRKQLTQVGAHVKPGDIVHVRVRDIPLPASDY